MIGLHFSQAFKERVIDDPTTRPWNRSPLPAPSTAAAAANWSPGFRRAARAHRHAGRAARHGRASAADPVRARRARGDGCAPRPNDCSTAAPHRSARIGLFERIAWEEALDEIADRLRDVEARYGAEAILHATGAGSVSGRGFSGASASRRFFALWGPVTATAGNMSNHCAKIAAHWMLGGAHARQRPGHAARFAPDHPVGHEPGRDAHGAQHGPLHRARRAIAARAWS